MTTNFWSISSTTSHTKSDSFWRKSANDGEKFYTSPFSGANWDPYYIAGNNLRHITKGKIRNKVSNSAIRSRSINILLPLPLLTLEPSAHGLTTNLTVEKWSRTIFCPSNSVASSLSSFFTAMTRMSSTLFRTFPTAPNTSTVLHWDAAISVTEDWKLSWNFCKDSTSWRLQVGSRGWCFEGVLWIYNPIYSVQCLAHTFFLGDFYLRCPLFLKWVRGL